MVNETPTQITEDIQNLYILLATVEFSLKQRKDNRQRKNFQYLEIKQYNSKHSLDQRKEKAMKTGKYFQSK